MYACEDGFVNYPCPCVEVCPLYVHAWVPHVGEQMCKQLYNECPSLETSVCPPPKPMRTSRILCNVSRCSKMSVYADLKTGYNAQSTV